MGRLIILIAAVFAAASRGWASADTACDSMGPRVDCGYAGMSEEQCQAKGCCWAPVDFGPGAPHVDLPWCFTPNDHAAGYKASSVTATSEGGVHAELDLSMSTQPELGPDIQALRFQADEVAPGILRMRLTDPHAQRWEVPTWLFQSDLLNGNKSGVGTGGSGGADMERSGPVSGGMQQGASQFSIAVKDDPFSIEVSRAGRSGSVGGGGGALFNTTGTRLVYKDQYLELTTWLSPSAVLFGAGERASRTLHLERNGMPRAIWSHDLGPTFLEQNMYSSHPFVMAVEQDGTAWGLLLLSSNAMDIVPTEDKLSWRVTGGVVDMFVLAGPTPLDVMDQLTQVVGRPAMMPYWSLGWHQCKYGYRSVWEVEEVVANYSAAGLPLEAIWTDIDHMDGWKDFTFHPTNFPLPEMQRFVANLHSNGQRWVPIVDPGIKVEPGYAPYEQGIQEDVFMRGVDGKPYLGWVWPGACHFPDFFLPRAQSYFTRQLRQHRELVPWDGIWIDMDEVSNFCTGDICQLRADGASGSETAPSVAELRDDPPWVCHLDCREASDLNDTQRGWLNPPYAVSNSLQRLPLGTKSMSVLAYHHDGSVEYNTHQLYGISECRVTQAAVRELAGRRPFVLSRASFIGTGAYAAHWTGDNSATWEQLAMSIPGVLAIGLWGIPMAGADICGFQGDTTAELCARWISLGAFYPFSRDHSDLHASYQELYRWPEVAEAGRKALGMRYRLLPYLYTAMHAAHATGAPVMRPLWMNFPGDPRTHTIDRQFMVGGSLLVSPVLEQGAASVDAYFPPGTWHSLWDDGQVVDAREGGKVERLDAPLGHVPLHMLGGTAIWMQQAGLTTAEVKRSPLTLVLALPDPAPPEQGAPTTFMGGGGAGRRVGGGTTVTRIVSHMYNDEGEELEVGTSLCNFLTVNATFSSSAPAGRPSAEVLLLFGSPAQLGLGSTHQTSGSHSPGGAGCAATDDTAAAAAHSSRFEWPELARVEVLGWGSAPVTGLTAEVVRRTDSCGGLEVLHRVQLPTAAASMAVDSGKLAVGLSDLHHKLDCPHGLRLSWEAVYPGGGVAVA